MAAAAFKGALFVALHAQIPTDPIIDAARDAAAAFAQSLPDYVVKRTTTRYRGSRPTPNSAANLAGKWQKPDIVTADVATDNGKEVYTNISVNGKPATKLPTGGEWSAGEFSNVLRDILASKSGAVFTNQRLDSVRNHPSYRYDFAIDESHSTWHLSFEGGQGPAVRYSPAYGGAIWIDRATGQVLRIEEVARGVPGYFPLDALESDTDYDFVTIGDEKYCLPARSEDITCVRGSTLCFRNETVFQDYKKFGADTSITFDGGAK